MHNIPLINILNLITRKVTKVLTRDFGELENIQSSLKGPWHYADKSVTIIQEILLTELNKSYPDYTIMINEDNMLHKGNNEYRFIINPIDGFENFTRTNNFFAGSIVLEKEIKGKYEVNACIIYSPVLGLNYYANKGQGSWVEKDEKSTFNSYRLRVSTNGEEKPTIIALNKYLNKSLENQQLIDKIEEVSNNIRVFGCELLSGALVASGKLDAAIFNKPNYSNISAIKLLVTEAGGICFNIKNEQRDTMIACSAAQYKLLFKHFT